jgi:hypothetical protein
MITYPLFWGKFSFGLIEIYPLLSYNMSAERGSYEIFKEQ